MIKHLLIIITIFVILRFGKMKLFNQIKIKNKLINIPKIRINSGNDILKILDLQKPIIITNGIFNDNKHLSNLWTDSYLSKNVNEIIQVEHSKSNKYKDTYNKTDMTMATYIENYKKKNKHIYFASENLPASLKKDFKNFKYMDLLKKNNFYLYDQRIFIGFNKLISFHTDSSNNFLFIVSGKKKVFLIDKNNVIGRPKHLGLIDLENKSHLNDPLFCNYELYTSELNEGDTLFIPFHWWHYVKTPSRSIGVSYWFNKTF